MDMVIFLFIYNIKKSRAGSPYVRRLRFCVARLLSIKESPTGRCRPASDVLQSGTDKTAMERAKTKTKIDHQAAVEAWSEGGVMARTRRGHMPSLDF